MSPESLSSPPHVTPTKNLDAILESRRIDERDWAILHRRCGLSKNRTLEEIGREYEVTRERIRQIQSKATKRLISRLEILRPIFDLLEKDAASIPQPFTDRFSQVTVIRAFQRILAAQNYIFSGPKPIYRLCIVIRAVNTDIQEKWPKLSFVVCALDPTIASNPQVQLALDHQRELNRSLTYEELGIKVLEEAGTPLHWRKICAEAELIGRRKSFITRACFNELVRRPDIFVRTAPGTYGLRKWGMSPRASNVELVAQYLHDRETVAAFGEILQAVREVPGLKKNSLAMMLDLNPRFYRSVENKYGLRGWLPPRDKQTLKTPSWQIEASDSFSRVERAALRGYDIESINRRDRKI